MENTKIVDFYFDYTSPYSYLAWETITKEQDVELNPIPVMVGKVISEVGSIGPGEIKSKREYLFKDCLRKAQEKGMVLRAPGSLPFNPLAALRFTIACEKDKELQLKVISTFFKYGWQEGNDFEDFEKLKSFVMNETGMSLDEYEALDRERSARKAIKANIVSAIEKGVFGVPTFVIDNEVFWGLDSLRFVKEKLNGQSKEISVEFTRFVKILEGEANV